MIVIAYPDQGAGTDPEAFGLAFHHQGPTFILVQKLWGWPFTTKALHSFRAHCQAAANLVIKMGTD